MKIVNFLAAVWLAVRLVGAVALSFFVPNWCKEAGELEAQDALVLGQRPRCEYAWAHAGCDGDPTFCRCRNICSRIAEMVRGTEATKPEPCLN